MFGPEGPGQPLREAISCPFVPEMTGYIISSCQLWFSE
jgi:hypothetical protein